MPKPSKGPPLKLLRATFNYDPETGVFTNRAKRGKLDAGAVIGIQRPDGYLACGMDYRMYLLHRLAWQYVTGEYPTDEIDHINGNKSDNRIANLRMVDRQTNQENWRKPRRNKTAPLGTRQHKQYPKKWIASITANRKTHYLGIFNDPEEAHQCYLEAKRRLHAGCTL